MDVKRPPYPAPHIVEVDELPCDLRGVADCVLVMQQWGWKLVGASEPDSLVQRLRFERVLTEDEAMETAAMDRVTPAVLHVFTCDHEEWVIAATPDDARDVYCAHIGVEPVLASAEDPSKECGTHASHWDQLPDDQITNVAEECPEKHTRKDRLVDGKPCPRGCDDKFVIHHSKPASEWAKQGRGYLASANW